MKSTHKLTIILLLLTSGPLIAQVPSEKEQELYQLIMAYRKEMGRSTIPLSSALTFVAQTHVKDLVHHNAETSNCNMHSWSSSGSWTPCCYTANHANAACMWSKPKELTSYNGNGYEISYHASGTVTASEALARWKRSPGHNAVIINTGIWKEKWRAIGVGIYQGYAVVWFGNEIDK